MNYGEITSELITWIEKNLDKNLRLDTVAAKAGYTKWHLQHLFRHATGRGIGEYIRERKLSDAAVDLRLTASPVLNIALKYHFGNQRTFSRAFRHKFQEPPGRYRRNHHWDFSLLSPPLQRTPVPVPPPAQITLPRFFLTGMNHKYICRPEQLATFDIDVRRTFWLHHVKNMSCLPKCFYALNSVQPCRQSKDELEVNYMTTINATHYLAGVIKGATITIPEGHYMQFIYEGMGSELQRFIISLYKHYLPQLKVVRRAGADIECYYFNHSAWHANIIRCHYFIPCTTVERTV